jgi:hypothetical protein
MADEIINSAADFALKDRLGFCFGNWEMARRSYEGLEIKAD